MGRFTFRLPDIGEGIAEAEIVAWHVKVGDRVEEDGRLADLMTDKATVEMESPRAGVVLEVAGEVGDVIAIGSPLVVLEVEGEVDERPSTGSGRTEAVAVVAPPPPPPPPSPTASPSPPPAPPEPVRAEPVEGPAPSRAPVSKATKAAAKVLASPAVRARAKELGIELSEVRPAEGERIRHADLDAFIAYGGASGYAPAGVAGQDQVIKIVGLRRRIAENMAASKRNIPHFTYVEECDVTALEKVRSDLNDNRGARPKLTLLPLLIVAVCRALPKFPMLNARYDDEAGVVTRHGAVHLGMATMTEAGLMVPIILDAQALNLWQLAGEIVRLSEAARDGKAKSDELSGSTFTLTSLGPLGGIASTPVINRPEVAILAPNRIVERPMFVADGMGGERVEKRKLMNLSISCDHRVVDGYDAAAFVQEVKRLIETPVLLLAN
ncbi:dihydrolipoamide acetyltransferase family protein [Altererythrobacter sp. Root672]|uniref:dihydrolipoamide acetyltransferase family protein n=1 Tax=Altererythrobacter sp. Root672 TaxID=1736584 RepID=UPI0007016FBE|nr:dihydrolipoamide acetyltransferase family protein [Altererythrobacter sp. Root672]KRA83213.1 branched-chain alpha-keto acid dehydrogenase subunit E2 [Altererythrobacter sp. Root672]